MPRLLSPLLCALALAACDSTRPQEPETDAGAPPSQPDAGATPVGVDAGPPDAGALVRNGPCGLSGTLAPGDQTRRLRVGDLDREYILHVPASYEHERSPVVLAFNGRSSAPEQLEEQTRLSETSDVEGFLLVYPRGAYDGSWNAGSCCGESQNRDVDDVGFVRAILDDVAAVACVDERRVFATGLSNGGFMSHRLACELSDRIAAIAPVAGMRIVPECEPGRAVSVMHFHGTSDFIVFYDGNPALRFPSVEESTAGWVERNGCSAGPRVVFQTGDTRCESWSDCGGGAEVRLCTVSGGGHTWPGGFVTRLGGHTTRDIIANDAMWEFFEAHPMP